MHVVHLGLILTVGLLGSPLLAPLRAQKHPSGDAPSPAYRMVPNEAEDEAYEPRTLEPTRSDIERRVAAVRFDFPKVDAAVAVVDRAIPDFFTSSRVRLLALTAVGSLEKGPSPHVVVPSRTTGRRLDGTTHLEALRDPRVRRALLYLAKTGIFAGDGDTTARPPRRFREPRPNE